MTVHRRLTLSLFLVILHRYTYHTETARQAPTNVAAQLLDELQAMDQHSYVQNEVKKTGQQIVRAMPGSRIETSLTPEIGEMLLTAHHLLKCRPRSQKLT